jgi:hypothetical protein
MTIESRTLSPAPLSGGSEMAYILSSEVFSMQSFAYAGGSVLAGVAAAYLGVTLVRALHP